MYKFIYINRLLQTSVKAIFFFPAFFRGATMKRRWALKAVWVQNHLPFTSSGYL